jgi:hypothetical protein
VTETANAHDAGDCGFGCSHPVHENEDAVIDLSAFLPYGGWDCPDAEAADEQEPVFL